MPAWATRPLYGGALFALPGASTHAAGCPAYKVHHKRLCKPAQPTRDTFALSAQCSFHHRLKRWSPGRGYSAFIPDPHRRSVPMKRQIIRVEPLSSYLERWKAPASVMTRHGDILYLSGLPPFDPDTGEVVNASIERQAELVLEQMKLCLETAGSSLDNVLKCNVYCTSVEKFAAINAVYERFFPQDPPARIFVCVPAWAGKFDIEIDCIAAV